VNSTSTVTAVKAESANGELVVTEKSARVIPPTLVVALALEFVASPPVFSLLDVEQKDSGLTTLQTLPSQPELQTHAPLLIEPWPVQSADMSWSEAPDCANTASSRAAVKTGGNLSINT
jgi:hypothetical protein